MRKANLAYDHAVERRREIEKTEIENIESRFPGLDSSIEQACHVGKLYCEYPVRYCDYPDFFKLVKYYGYHVDPFDYDSPDQTKLLTIRWNLL